MRMYKNCYIYFMHKKVFCMTNLVPDPCLECVGHHSYWIAPQFFVSILCFRNPYFLNMPPNNPYLAIIFSKFVQQGRSVPRLLDATTTAIFYRYHVSTLTHFYMKCVAVCMHFVWKNAMSSHGKRTVFVFCIWIYISVYISFFYIYDADKCLISF